MVTIGKKEFFKEKISKMEDLKKIPLIIHRRYLPLINDYCLNKQIQIQLKVMIVEHPLFGPIVVLE